MRPFVLTLMLDEDSRLLFNTLRQKYFPPERNYLDAHLSLFHQLPPDEEKIVSVIQETCVKQALVELNIAEVKNIGNGVAYKIESSALMGLHKHLQQQWQQWLIPQDQHKLWPHITIQNKVKPAIAAALRNILAESFTPFTALGTGLMLWEYQGGPWSLVDRYKFEG